MKYRYLILSALAALSLSCTKEEYTLSGTGEKTPLEISVSLDGSGGFSQTKASSSAFEQNDKLYAFVEQVQRSGSQAPYSYASKISKLVEFTVGTAGSTVLTDNLGTVLYWDDFSSDTDDIRDADRFLRVGYGFCFNGGTPSTGLDNATNESNGTIQGWSVKTDQSTAANLKNSDLLWANHSFVHEQDATKDAEIQYVHVVADRKALPVVYKHAMSKVTVELKLDEGFGNFSGDTYPTLYANTTASEVNAYNQTITTVVNPTGIKMHLSSSADKTRVYEAIIAPTLMKADQKLMEVTVEGNKYNINLTDALLTTVPSGLSGDPWSTKLKDYSAANGGTTLSGVNYRIVVTLKKQRIEVQAQITDWSDVTSSTEGEIKFDADVKDPNITGTFIDNGAKFDLWRSTVNADANYGSVAAVFTSDGSKWTPSTTLYWPNGSDNYYFRALTLLEGGEYKSVAGSKAAEQGKDLLWAQTSAHQGTDAAGNSFSYAEGAAIKPRTGNVPLTFEHALSKISVELKNAAGASDDEKVDLTGAKISIINLYDKGNISISNGEMVADDLAVSSGVTDGFTIKGTVTLDNGKYVWKDNLVIPQSLTSDKTGASRDTSPKFYSSANLTYIYANGKSNGQGTGAYYLTSELDFVPAVLYTDQEARTVNAELTNAVSTSTVKTPATYWTAEEAKEHNAELSGAVKEGDAKDNNGGTYTQAEADTYNATLTGAVHENEVKTAAVYYTQAEADAINAALPGAVQAGDIKVDAYYKLPDDKTPSTTSLTSHTIGELEAQGNKIMLFVTLANGTRYSIELSKCKVDGSETLITKWEKGKHYSYSITLGKEEVTFRALIKDWVETSGSGNATLDWD